MRPGIKVFADKNYLVLLAILLLSLIAMLITHPVVSSDGYNYYVYLRSAVIDHDLDFHNDFKHFTDIWFWKTYQPRETPTGYLSNVFSVGPAVLWAPFYLVAHGIILLINLLGGSITADGFSRPYQLAVFLGTNFFAALGFMLTYRLGKTLFRPKAALFGTITVWLGSFILYYTIFEPSMSHALSFFTVSLFIWRWHITRQRRNIYGWLLLGLAAGLMMLVRWQNGLFMLYPALESLSLYFGAVRTRHLRRLSDIFTGNIAFLAAAAAAFLPQLLAWKIIYGRWLTLPQGGSFMKWDAPMLLEVWFSTRHGLFAWTPLVYLAAAGWLLLIKKDRQLAGITAVTFLVMSYTNSAIADWWAGWGFGMRRFDGFLLPFALGLGALLNITAGRYKKTVPIIIIFLLSASVIFNFYLLRQVRSGTIHRGGPVAFARLLPRSVLPLYNQTGYPFSFPANWLFSLRYGLPPARYDTLTGAYIDDPQFYGGTISSASGREYLGTGWSTGGKPGEAGYLRTAGPSSVLYLPLRSPADYLLHIRLRTLAPDNERQQGVRLILNDRQLPNLTPTAEWTECTLDIPRSTWQAGINVLHLAKGEGQADLAIEYLRFEGKIKTGPKEGYWK